MLVDVPVRASGLKDAAAELEDMARQVARSRSPGGLPS